MFRDLPRYPEMMVSQFWAATAPSHWEVHPGLAVLAENRRKNDGLIESQVLSLSYGRVVVKPAEKQRGLVPDSYESYQILGPGDIVVRPTDLQNDQTSIRVGHVKDRGIITSAYIGLRARGSWSDAYAYHYLAVVDSSKRIYGMGSGLRQQLGWPDLKRMPCLVPPPEEQAAIVKYLAHANARIDKVIAAKRRLIALLEEQRQAEVSASIANGDTATGDYWFPRLRAGWGVVSLGRVLHRAVDGPHFSPPYANSGVPFLSARNLKPGRWSLGDLKYIDETLATEFDQRIRPEIGDVLYSKGGTTGVAKAVDIAERFQVWVHIAVLKLRRDLVSPDFLELVLNSSACYEQSQLETRGATNQDLGLGRMKRISIPIAPLEAQTAFVREIRCRVDHVTDAVGRTRREITLLQEFRTRLVADVVTGQVDVRAIAATLPNAPEVAVEAFEEDVPLLDEELDDAVEGEDE
ncbi:restriction endonuclease subunit S [Propionibacterium freudenreichii]|uniref:restriction endonuclease subunit S n=1 Tax=Propionibacterium freudenreichii TaxID=1744 RepID=UPI001021CF51|nr:restriction endonuclease subunit S [Propionibacterium freudenreichii]MCT2996638.1 restriction endonuclease subunit S [Propionibacterium freudenreichii]MDK9646770.1 restriction endonuclease subunit S [Propionibacterium freudenreichii]MDK9666690.1 restriction endonuclease subunit S [Propionibacterium freudenreichii]